MRGTAGHDPVPDAPPRPTPKLDTSNPGRLLAAVRRYPLVVFFAWFFTVGQAVVVVPVVARGLYDVDLPAGPFVIAATFLGLLLPALAITRVVDGAEGLRAFWARTVCVRVPLRWYAFAVVGVPLATIAVTAALSGPPEHASGPAVTSAVVNGLLVQLVVVFVTVNWWEEVAWTGFVQARLQARHGATRAAVTTGAVFALGHVSVVVDGSASATALLVALLVAVSVPFRALQAWVYNRTGSLVVVGLVHAAGNATAVGSVLGAGLLPRLYPGEGSGGLVFPVLAVLGLVVLAATRARLGASHDPATTRPDPDR